jgi:serine phosphatase RsbU (regulator of sigma subunit)
LHKVLGINENFTILGWQWNYTVVYLTLLGALTLTVFVRELISDRSEKQRLAAELAASRAVQQVLIPDHTPEIAGFTIRSVYKPYGEVGGDFYQILPLPNGGALIAIGDVSGKGMPAAMMVSLLVGALHALVETTSSPGELLSGLNRLVQGRSHGGFTTCLILGIEPDGTVTFANAGHIPPYLQGKELLCENGLPLGLIVAGAYTESSFLLGVGEQLTLVTDGVVEARNEAGELFGFERTAANASLMAEAIAQQAQVFGQDDDITVLTVARMATE